MPPETTNACVKLWNAPDDLQDQVEEDDRGGEQRQGDGPELADPGGTVDRRRLVVHLGGDLPQAREEDDHRRTERPHVQGDERPQRGVRVGHPPPLALDAEDAEERVDEAVDAEHLAPQDRDGDGAAEQGRQVERRPVEREAPHAAVEQQREAEGDDELQRDGGEHVGERDPQRVEQPGGSCHMWV